MSIHLNQSGIIKGSKEVFIRQASIWKSVTKLWTKYLGTWKLIFPYYVIKITGTSLGPGDNNNYLYERIGGGTVVVTAGDRLEFDIWIDRIDTYASVECHLLNLDPYTVLRGMGIVDQNGISTHPGAIGIADYAYLQWYHRIIPLDAVVGATLYNWILAFENDPAGSHSAYVKDIKVVDSAGNIKLQVFKDVFDELPDTAYSSNFTLDEKLMIVKGD